MLYKLRDDFLFVLYNHIELINHSFYFIFFEIYLGCCVSEYISYLLYRQVLDSSIRLLNPVDKRCCECVSEAV